MEFAQTGSDIRDNLVAWLIPPMLRPDFHYVLDLNVSILGPHLPLFHALVGLELRMGFLTLDDLLMRRLHDLGVVHL